MSNSGHQRTDHAEAVRGRNRQISLAWLFPLIALAAAGWMFATHVMSRGPEIEISFIDAPGIEAGKTALIYRGVVAGKVVKVDLNRTLTEALVTVRLEKFAAGLAVEGSDFWIERPVLSLQGASGLTSLIQGNSIRARMGTGKHRHQFRGLESSPVLSMDDTALHVRLQCEETQPLDRGAPVTFRGVRVGRVCEQSLSEQGKPYIDLEIQNTKAPLLKTSSRFWVVPATSVTLGPGGIKLDFSGLDTLIQGGVAFDDFGVPGAPLADDSTAPLLESEALARACGTPFVVTFEGGRGIKAGQTRITYLGLPVGMVTAARPVEGRVEVTAQLDRAYDHLRRTGSEFTLIEPVVSMQGIRGLETLITGVAIDFLPGGGSSMATRFSGTVPSQPQQEFMEESEAGRKFRLLSSGTTIGVGAAVIYRGTQVGTVLEKKLSGDGKSVELRIGVQEQHARLVRENTVFWEERGLRGSVGFVNIRIQTATPLPLTGTGAITFATPDAAGPVAPSNKSFVLYDKPRREWSKWNSPPANGGDKR
ncbi:MAG: MCE family protein [Chthoniobacterales bacterium]|nr:MCE family protein [Chthoniobacterales bacterium]